MQLNDFSEPEPDVAVVRADPLDYEDHHPTPGEIFWLIKVSDTKLKRDLELKAPTYARSQVLEYWVLDVHRRYLHVFRTPGATGYASVRVLGDEDVVAPLAFADCRVAVKDFLRPLS